MREKAIKWWNYMDVYKRLQLVNEYYPNRKMVTLTGLEIEKIYLSEIGNK